MDGVGGGQCELEGQCLARSPLGCQREPPGPPSNLGQKKTWHFVFGSTIPVSTHRPADPPGFRGRSPDHAPELLDTPFCQICSQLNKCDRKSSQTQIIPV